MFHVHVAFTCSKSTIKTPEQSKKKFKSLLLTPNSLTHCSFVSIVDFEQVNAGWVDPQRCTEKLLVKVKRNKTICHLSVNLFMSLKLLVSINSRS